MNVMDKSSLSYMLAMAPTLLVLTVPLSTLLLPVMPFMDPVASRSSPRLPFMPFMDACPSCSRGL